MSAVTTILTKAVRNRNQPNLIIGIWERRVSEISELH
jgi:hypothetical protein